MKFRTALLGLALALAAVAGHSQKTQESAWDAYVRQNPRAVDDDAIGLLERRILDALTPEQASAFFAGADPTDIVLAEGETLADFIAATLSGAPGMVYVPVNLCRLFATFQQTAPVAGLMAIDETREYVARGSGTAHTDQGGEVDCLIPTEAAAIVMHVRVVSSALGAAGRLKMWPSHVPEPPQLTFDYEPTSSHARFNHLVVQELCPVGTCPTGEFKVKTAMAAAHVRGDVVGYFRPIETTDLPGGAGSGLDADTLDGIDSTGFALDPHTHAGEDVTSGTVADARIDAAIARDTEVFGIVLTNDGAGSMLDSDKLDGRDSLDLMLQVDNCLTVSPSCPAAAAEALAARCWQTISAALGEIGTGLPAATAMNKYLIKVGPGIYPEQVTMKEYVDIEGAGEKPTTITNASSPTLAGADNAELRHLTVENTGGGQAIQNSGVSPMLTHVTARATGAGAPIAIKNGMGAAPMLTHVTTSSDGDGVENDGATATIRDSVLGGTTNGIENVTATANIVNAQIVGGATDGGTGATFTCLGAYDGTFTELDANCQP